MLSLAAPAGALAQKFEATSVPASVVTVGPNEQAIARRIEMTIGRSIVVELPRDAKEVFVANPKVANAVVRSTRKLFLIGLENGATSVFVMDQEGRQIAALEVSVGRDLNVLLQTLRSSFPHASMELKPAGDSIILLGTVNSNAEAQQAVDIATAFVGMAGNGTRGAIINSLTIKGKDQVMLRVTIAEVGRTVLKQFGINTTASWTPLGANPNKVGGTLESTPPFPISVQPFPENNFLSASISKGGFNATATLQAFERAGVSRILAEPTLTAISGESARFTAGGEIPVPRSRDCTVVNGSNQLSCTIGVEYKPYGVTLNFTPVVMSENRISLRVGTEVSELDGENRIALSGINVIGLKVRRQETTVELPSGGTMMTAGLLQQTSSQAVNGTPGLMNLPILGALFRSRDFQRKETELVILVTPMIAKPVEPGQLARPDDGFVDAHDGQGILLGRLNRIYGTIGAAPGPRYRGRFGFITD
jgi:pilus assembly protein CpaC